MSLQRRAVNMHLSLTVRTSALLCIFLFLALSCRNTEDSQPGSTSPTIRFIFTPGDQYLVDGWRLNQAGVRIDSTQVRHVQQVVSTQGMIGGMNDVIVVDDSVTILRSGKVQRDTLWYSLTPDGGLAQYGFLAEIIKTREGREIPMRWDKLFTPEATGWTVGTVDLVGREQVSATLSSTPYYFQIVSGGQSIVFPAYRVEMSGSTLDMNLWVADSPTCIPRFEEYPEPYIGILQGSLLILTEKIPAP
jgi:hypothetical protein